ncbi:MAG: ABC transporter ATP-binding protein [Actinomycetota bacterium]
MTRRPLAAEDYRQRPMDDRPLGDAPPAVSLRGVEVRIEGATILGPLDLRIRRGERWVVMGPNGSGKTTLLSVVGARRQPSRGRAAVLGRMLGRSDVRLLHGMIGHASHALAERMPPGMRVDDVVLSGKDAGLVTWFQRFDAADHERARERLVDVGCADLCDRRIETCSQGERQRVMLARALFRSPELLLLDEAAAGLDLPAREHLLRALERSLAGSDDPTLVMATHHPEEIPPSASHAVLLRRGRVVAAGAVGSTLTAPALSACFDLDLEVGRRGERWWATLRS